MVARNMPDAKSYVSDWRIKDLDKAKGWDEANNLRPNPSFYQTF